LNQRQALFRIACLKILQLSDRDFRPIDLIPILIKGRGTIGKAKNDNDIKMSMVKTPYSMLKMMKYICIAVTLIPVSGLVFDMAAGQDEAVIFSHLQWDCADRDGERYCDVSFELINKTSTPQIRKIHIRSNLVWLDKEDEHARAGGRRDFSIMLAPREVVAIHERMEIGSIPDNITVSIGE